MNRKVFIRYTIVGIILEILSIFGFICSFIISTKIGVVYTKCGLFASIIIFLSTVYILLVCAHLALYGINNIAAVIEYSENVKKNKKMENTLMIENKEIDREENNL